MLDPRCAHEVLPWTGTRITLIAYTPDGLGKLSYEDIKNLEDYGYPTPLSQLPEFFINNRTVETHLNRVEIQDEVIKPDDEEDGLSDEEKGWFQEAAAASVAATRAEVNRLEEAGVALLRENGMEVITEVDKAPFRDLAEAAYSVYTDQYGPEMVERIRAVE